MADTTVEDEPGVMPAVSAAMKAALDKLKGLTGTGTMSNRGFTRGITMNVPGDADAEVRKTLEQVRESLSNISTPLPEEAVGTGARWEVKMPIKSQGMKIDQTVDSQVLSIDGDHLSITNVITQSANRQKVQNPAMQGAKAEVTRMTGAGTGSMMLDLTHIVPVGGNVDFHIEFAMSLDIAGQKQDMNMKMDMDMLVDQK
jgi:hypothetical protein